MPDIPVERIKQIKSFPSLVKFLRDDLDWPLGSDEIDELVFEYEPDELGIDPEIAVKIREIKQLRPLVANQPWGIFYIGFEPKRLPVVVLRRVLQKLVVRKRQSAESAHRNAWELHDLLFISSYGEENQRAITFAHFSEDEESKLPTLRVIGWDSQDTPLHVDRCIAELSNLKYEEELEPDEWRRQWSEAFTLRHREVITSSKALAKELAALATRIRNRVNVVLAVESEKGPMRQLYKAFQQTLIHDLSEDDFADMYAQTITYGLFSTKRSRPAGLVAENLIDMVPRTNPFLRELLSTFLTVGGRKGKIDFDELGIDDVIQTLRNTDMDAVMRDFGDSKPEEDPVIHFYEDFLKEYDAEKKVKRGVFYTPKPVVSFIVRSVHEILQKEFGLEDGLADTTTWGEMAKRNKAIKIPEGVSENEPFVQILDPAVGTGTFLVEAIDVIRKTMHKKWENQGHLPLEFIKLWNEYVPRHLLPRLYGFELMMAPYAIAHMKIGLKLFETGYQFGADKRARIYLTNSLEPPEDFSDRFEFEAPALAHEAKAVNTVKRHKRFSVVIGNPPYSIMSANLTSIAKSLVDQYRHIDGVRVKEKGALKAEVILQDDYIKFLALAQNTINAATVGLVGFITNSNCYMNPTLRGLRYSLLQNFKLIYGLDLGGQSKAGIENDENVFDIKTGAAISILVRTPQIENLSKFGELHGLRSFKYERLGKTICTTECNQAASPQPEQYLFKVFSLESYSEYQNYFPLDKMFAVTSIGIKTARDHLVLDFDRQPLETRMEYLLNPGMKNSELRKQFNILDNTQWCFDKARKKFQQTYSKDHFSKIEARLFDTRWIYFHPSIVFNTRPTVNKHVHGKKNLCLLAMRRIRTFSYNHFFVTNRIAMGEILSSADNCNFFPLYLYHDNALQGIEECSTNFTSEFVSVFSKRLRLKTEGRSLQDGMPEDIFYYAYAVFHSPDYRSRYGEFLKIDFPRVPLTSSVELFRALAKLGGELVSLHLMKSALLDKHITKFPVSGDNTVTKVGETGKKLKDIEDGKGKLYINSSQYFDNLPEEVWNFHIGGYQVCYKWLYDRKKAGRKLSAEDIDHYHKIVVVLSETIKIMGQIDKTIEAHGGWPIK